MAAPSVIVEIFPTLKLARYVMAIGGNEENDKGIQVRPLARVSNVVVTVFANASNGERSRALRAVTTLRRAGGLM